MGPLNGLRIVEIAGIGPVPFCGMLLGDLGADVIRIDRVGGNDDPLRDVLGRSRRSVAIDLKHPHGAEIALRLLDAADAVIEGMRPGVMERLGLGPEECLARNPRLVYGRMTGWGQVGPLAPRAGHDIDYIAITGALHAVGDADRPPPPPLNIFGDYGGGALYLAMGVLAALHERSRSGQGQVVDAAMVDGAASLMTMFYELRAAGLWTDRRGVNLLDGGAPWYRTYRTSDDRFVAVGAIEPEFYALLLEGLGLDPAYLPDQYDTDGWTEMADRFSGLFAQRTRAEWLEVFEGTDACVAPVLSIDEAVEHPHLRARSTFVDTDAGIAPGPAPRFGRSSDRSPGPAPAVGEHTDTVLGEIGYSTEDLAELRSDHVIG